MPDSHNFDGPSMFAAISGWITAVVGFVWTGGRHAQRFEELEEKIERLEPVLETLATIKNDIGWIKDRLK